MTALKPECVANHRKKTFAVEERNSKVTFQNPEQHDIQEIKVDGCLITVGLRCDYLILADRANSSVLVELKGSDVVQAIRQLTTSHKALLEHSRTNRFWLVSTSRCPLTSTEVQNLILRTRRDYGVVLKIKNSPVEHSF